MKKLIALIIALSLLLTFAGCAKKSSADNTQGVSASPSPEKTDNENKNLEGTLESILQKIYDTVDIKDDYFKEYIKTGLQTETITSENCEYFLGKAGLEFKEAIASEPIISPSAYSLCLVRVKEGADIEKMKTEIKENADPRKWICVGVDPKNVFVDNVGDVIILVMSDQAGQELLDAFKALKK